MKPVNLSIGLFVLFSILACGQNTSMQQVDFLIGTWKIEGKESYEVWKKVDNTLNGISYNIKTGEKYITEKIEVKLIDKKITYIPTVFDQNDGKGIPFILNLSNNNIFSFENPQHDFPKKIQYKILNDKELYVSVLGENDKGFSYKLIREAE